MNENQNITFLLKEHFLLMCHHSKHLFQLHFVGGDAIVIVVVVVVLLLSLLLLLK